MANVSMTYAPQFSTMTQAESFVQSLIAAYFTAFAIATGVSLLIFPLTSRQLFFEGVLNSITGLRSALVANTNYLISLESSDMFAAQRTNTAGEKPPRSPEAEAFLAKVRSLSAIQAKLGTDLEFGKQEIAVGYLGPDDLKEITKRLRILMIHVVGLSSLSDIFDRISQQKGWDRSKSFATATVDEGANATEKARIQSLNEWHELIRLLKEPFASISEVIDEGLEHVLIVLRLVKESETGSTNGDTEAVGDKPKPGSKAFATYIQSRAREFLQNKQVMLRGWCHVHGLELPDDFFSNPYAPDVQIPDYIDSQDSNEARGRMRRQLMIMLYVEYLLYSMARRTHDLIKYVDELKDSGKLDRRRIVVPGYKHLKKKLLTALREQSVHHDDFGEYSDVYLGQA